MSWAEATIGKITHVVTKGTTPTTYGMPFTDDGINFVKAEALNGDSGLDHAGFAHVSEETNDAMKRSILQNEDVLVTIAGAQVGRCGFVRDCDLPANTNQAVGIVRVDTNRAVPRYVYYHFKNPSTFTLCQNIGAQAAQPNVNLTTLKGFRIQLPDLHVQRSIADILSAYDDLIENNRRRMALLEEAARQLYREWFVRLRFPGHEHTRITDGVPEGWERKTLGEIATTNAESYKARDLPDEINYVDISSVEQGRIVSKATMVSADAPGRARRKAKSGDVIWSNVRPNLRAYALVFDPEANDVFSTGFTVLTPIDVPFTYLYQLVTTDQFVGHLVNHATGVGYPAVRPEDFERAVVPIPTKMLLEEFHRATEPNYRLVSKLDQQIKKLVQARDLLLPRLMSGELAV